MPTDIKIVRRTPKMYRNVTNRAVLRAEEAGIGFSFDGADGEKIRLFLDIASARRFCNVLAESLEHYSRNTTRHSPKSDGIPSSE